MAEKRDGRRSSVLRRDLAREDEYACPDDGADARRREVQRSQHALQAVVRTCLVLKGCDALTSEQVHARSSECVWRTATEGSLRGGRICIQSSRGKFAQLRGPCQATWRISAYTE